jgi:hypothetical protein
MFNLFKRKFRIAPSNACGSPEPENPQVTPDNQCKVLSFKYHNGLLTSPHLAAGYEPPEKTPNAPGRYKLYFIWDYL